MTAAPAYIYASIRDLLAARIGSQEIAPGTVLKEARISGQLGVSRAPVRRALALLADQGLIRAAEGQGYIVGTAEAPVHLTTRRLHEILTARPDGIDRSAAWERIFERVRDEVTACMPFGSWRIQEAELGDHYHVSRTVAREVLWRLMDRRLIGKDSKSHWIVGQMTARDLRETLELRRLLEPQALAHVAGALDRGWLNRLSARIDAAAADFPGCGPDEVDGIESALFGTLYEGLRNARMLASIRRNQISLVVQKMFRHHFPMIDDLPSLQDYGQILHHLRAGTGEVARVLLTSHLARIEPLILARLRVLSLLPPPRRMPWLTPVD